MRVFRQVSASPSTVAAPSAAPRDAAGREAAGRDQHSGLSLRAVTSPSQQVGRRALIAALVAVALIVPIPVQAAGASEQWLTDDERQASEDRQQRQADLQNEIDLLRISDVELQGEAQRLDAAIADLEARTQQAVGELASTERRLAELEAELDAALQEYEARQRLAAERAVVAYMQPPMDMIAVALNAEDMTEVERRRILADNVVASDRRIMADRSEAAAALALAESEVEQTATTLRSALAAQEADLEQLRVSRQRSAEVAAALDMRISSFQSEANSLAASEADLVSLISQRQQAAATTTTTTPPTTAPPVTEPDESADGGGPGTSPGSGGPGSTAPSPSPTAAPAPAPPPPPPPPPPPAAAGGLLWPTSGVLTSTYGWRWGAMHRGIDIGAPSGTPIYASAAGTVIFSGWMGGYGNLILIDHLDGRVTAYAHQSRLAVSGGSVGRGQLIGYVGSTGDSTGPHLHFEVRVNGVAVDPLPLLR